MKKVKVKMNDWQISEYFIRVKCPYCNNKMNFYSIAKYIDETDYCTNCGKEFSVTSEVVDDKQIRIRMFGDTVGGKK